MRFHLTTKINYKQMKKSIFIVLVIILSLSLSSCKSFNSKKHSEVKNIILLIGDGMGVTQVYAGMSVAKNKLNIERSQFTGFSKTYSSSDYTTDSGAGATAISTGQKSYNGSIAVDSSGKELKSITDYANEAGLSTGIVATCALSHATPAAFAVSNVTRNDYNKITSDYTQSGVDVLIGGGAFLFDSLGVTDSLRNLGYEIQNDLDLVDLTSDAPLLSLPYEQHPPSLIDGRNEEYLRTATKIATQKLSYNDKGFFLMIEASQIDWAGHKNNIDYVVSEMLDFDKAIGEAYDFADANPGTLVIVTADHETGGLILPKGSIKDKTIVSEFASGGHTGIMVPIFTYGTGAEEFSTIMENTDIFVKMMSALGLGE